MSYIIDCVMQHFVKLIAWFSLYSQCEGVDRVMFALILLAQKFHTSLTADAGYAPVFKTNRSSIYSASFVWT